MLLIDPTRPVPDIRAGAVSDPSPVESADDEQFWKQAGGGNRDDERALFADGKPVDRTYRSRQVVGDEDAPEVLGVSSGYKPEVIIRPIPRMGGRAKKSLSHGGGGAILILGVAIVAGFVLWLVFRGAPRTRAEHEISQSAIVICRRIERPAAEARFGHARSGQIQGCDPGSCRLTRGRGAVDEQE